MRCERPRSVDAMNATIDVTVASVIELHGRFLIVEEWVGNRRVFNQPAGHLEPGEAVLGALARETLEETGHEFTPEHLVGIYSWQTEDRDSSFLRICCSGAVGERHIDAELDDGIIAAHWLTRDELLSPRRVLRSPLVMRAMDDYLGGARYPLDCIAHIDNDWLREPRLA